MDNIFPNNSSDDADSIPGFQTAGPNQGVPRQFRPLQPPNLHPYRHNAAVPRPQDANKNLICIAIDFGMTFTGYAFGFAHDPSKVYTLNAGSGVTEDRVPTTVLLKPDMTFHSFGFDAEKKYTELIQKGQHKNWMYFEKFKMALYETKKIKLETPVHDREGREMPAIQIFSMIIHYLKEQAENHIRQKTASTQNCDFKWLITIPAIWADSAKQFMREAALNAGISEDKLHLVLEPEAAAAHCKELAAQWQQHYVDKNQNVVEFSPGFKYILADLGGGTADICVHEILENGNLKEIFPATGDALGGSYVNMEFLKFLQKLVGADVLKEFNESSPENYLELFRDFERKKKSFCTNTKDLKFSIHPDFSSLIKRMTGERLEQIIPNTDFAGKVNFNPGNNKLTITNEIVKGFFDISVTGIVQILKDILSESNDRGIKTLILVGGYSESPYLKECIETELKQLRVLHDPDARLAILKGAVMLGFKPITIQQRRARFSYGFYMIQPFESSIHPPELKTYMNGMLYCDRIFLKLIEKGEILTLGRAFKYTSTNRVDSPQAKRKPFLVRVVRSTKENPKFCTQEEGCNTIGTITVQPPRGGWPNVTYLTLHIIVGEAEFVLNVLDENTLQMYEADLSFL